MDATGTYRYLLRRQLAFSGPTICFLMLNPSTADAYRDDPTLRRCIDFGRRWGYGQLEVVNLFAYRSSKPAVLLTVDDPVGPGNFQEVTDAAERADLVVAAWGAWAPATTRRVARAIVPPVPLTCLGRTKLGEPRHPLYAPLDSKPEPWSPDDLAPLPRRTT